MTGDNAFTRFFIGFYAGFKRFGAMIVEVINFILLSIAYFLGVGFASILGKITGKKFLNLKSKNVKSYWKDRPKEGDKDSFYNQY